MFSPLFSDSGDPLNRLVYRHLYEVTGHGFAYLAVYFVAVFLAAHLDELAIDALEDVEDVPHQRSLAHLTCTGEGRDDKNDKERLKGFRNRIRNINGLDQREVCSLPT